MILLKMSANGGSTATVFFNSVKKISSCEAYVFCIAERNGRKVDHTVLINQRGLLFFYAKYITRFTTSIDGLWGRSDSVAKFVELIP